jgi:hypothetical protein
MSSAVAGAGTGSQPWALAIRPRPSGNGEHDQLVALLCSISQAAEMISAIVSQALIRHGMPSESVIALALFNPLQVFRTAAMMLFDPHLVLLGQSAYVILDAFGQLGYKMWALAYPVVLGTVCAWIGYAVFRRSDLP